MLALKMPLPIAFVMYPFSVQLFIVSCCVFTPTNAPNLAVFAYALLTILAVIVIVTLLIVTADAAFDSTSPNDVFATPKVNVTSGT